MNESQDIQKLTEAIDRQTAVSRGTQYLLMLAVWLAIIFTVRISCADEYSVKVSNMGQVTQQMDALNNKVHTLDRTVDKQLDNIETQLRRINSRLKK